MHQTSAFLTAVLILLLAWPAGGQSDSAKLEAAFRFQDGVYLSLESLRQNQPDYRWQDIQGQLAANAEYYRAQAEYLSVKGSRDTLACGRVWGIVLDGLPYICLAHKASQGQNMRFAGLRVRGRISYYEYERKEQRLVEITAYNPLTGRPFRRGNITKKETVAEARILHLPSGKMGPLDRPTLLQMIQDDRQLYRTVDELPENASVEKLYKCVLIYDDRNPMFLPVPSKKKN